jgi:hydrogenase nickel incorporation protein HypA/HybF
MFAVVDIKIIREELTNMHELSITGSILDIALSNAQKAGASRITDLYLVLGQLSYIVDDSVQFYWDTIAKGTAAEGARLHFQRVPAELLCLDCKHRYSPDKDVLACPNCESVRVKIVSGDEFRLDSIDVDDTDPIFVEK